MEPSYNKLLRKKTALKVSGLYVIVDPSATLGRNVIDIARAALLGGASAIQYRDKKADKNDQLLNAQKLREVCEIHGGILIINDHPRLASVSEAHGVHLGQQDMALSKARDLLYEHQFIGTSNALLTETSMAISEGADYIAVGAMHYSNSKSNTRNAGVETLKKVKAKEYDVPIVAIGGINLNNVDSILEAGADGICVISAVCAAEDPEKAAHLLTERIEFYRYHITR